MSIEAADRLEISARINGREVRRQVPCRMTLAQFLRDSLELTGTKVSCELQVCGACTVLVDGEPVSSCTYLAVDVDGRRVETIEGMVRDDGQLHPLQQAFVENSALQCGFCTPGFLMMSRALLETNPAPTREDVVHHLEGNICRCTGYVPIVDAVLTAAERMRAKGESGNG